MNITFKNKKGFLNTTKSGFTLVEMLVALSVILIGVTAVFSVSQIGLSSTAGVKNRIAGMFLAEEAMDGVKNIKDSNLLAGVDWLTGLRTCSTASAPNGCLYNIQGGSRGDGGVEAITSSGNDEVKIIESPAILYYQNSNSGTGTGFIRQVYVDEIVPDDKEALVTVKISRSPQGTFVPFSVSEYIYHSF